MENTLIENINFHFGQEGQIFYCKFNEYNKNKQLNLDEILHIKQNLESNQQLQYLENRICYISCCIYLLAKIDQKYIIDFGKNIIKILNLKQNP